MRGRDQIERHEGSYERYVAPRQCRVTSRWKARWRLRRAVAGAISRRRFSGARRQSGGSFASRTDVAAGRSQGRSKVVRLCQWRRWRLFARARLPSSPVSVCMCVCVYVLLPLRYAFVKYRVAVVVILVAPCMK